ncbi:hypothetical protein F53441_13151 [Fusarium austroafricanum]|uniref:Heterokaryon incompatibility domain-containing protein n=1 Tax=Fusarium austroafricanum TaxID=2364996 RepID=A0A8H4JSW5_9HYPO|nr:hypothetical protein F53441_13151 [Fusarium austroafricanum]
MEHGIPGDSPNPYDPPVDLDPEAYELTIDHDEQGPDLFKVLFVDPAGLWMGGALQCYYRRWKTLLEHHFSEAPSEYMAIGGTRCSGRNICFADFVPIVINFCKDLSDGDIVNLTELAESLMLKDLVTRDAAQLPRIKQLVFATLGWISMLYIPAKNYVDGNLVIQVRGGSTNSRRLHTWVRPEQAMENITGSLRDVLGDFSNDSRGPLSCINGLAGPAEIDVLKATNLNFFVLAKLGGLRIIWADSICMHLELDRREKTIMMFQHPSICALMCSAGDKGIYLDSLPGALEPSPAGSFYREVLLTYRLVFGQHKRSWRLCCKEGGLERQKQGSWKIWLGWGLVLRSFRLCGITKAEEATRISLGQDSLLLRLCCADCTQEPVYDEIGAPDVRSVYSAQHDFPFFGDRLIALQEYVRLIEPMDLRALYYDRRDLSRCMSVWTTMVFGTVTLVLATLGVFLAAGQIGTTFKPN